MSQTLYSTTLEGEALVHLRGKAIPAFLQGQLTCDLRPLSPQRAVPGAMCNVKGRVISDLWIIAVNDEHCCLRLRDSMATAFADNLERYARFSRISVAVDDRSDAIRGFYGPGLATDSLDLAASGGCARADSAILLRSGDGLVQRIALDSDTSGDASAAPPVTKTTADALTSPLPGSESDWRALELLEGHFAIEAGNSEQFTPQALNFDRSGRVAFDKGCYTGQEVVARLHYKGRAKQRLQVFSTSTSGATNAPKAGAAILDRDGQAVGDILRSEALYSREVIVAALLRHDEDRDDLRLTDGRELNRVEALRAV